MKLKKIRLQNFRQFHGDQTLLLSTDPERNVTLIHAENGIGKTTILNTILWCFYGEVTKKFERKDEIVNFQSLDEGNRSALVEITFEHEDSEFVAQRAVRLAQKPEYTFNAFRIENGAYKALTAADTFINSVVPKEMARYFFFDGEHAETFSAATNVKEVNQAIRNILGCNLAETAIEDLQAAAKDINRQIGALPGSIELQQIEKILSNLGEAESMLKGELARRNEEREATLDQIEGILAALRLAEGASQIQEQRDNKLKELKSVEEGIKIAEQSIVKWIGQKSLPLISRKLASEMLEFIDEEGLKGRIPSPYNEDFVKGLLQKETCICERPLKPATSEWKAVLKLLDDAATAKLMGRIVQARTCISVLRDMRSDVTNSLEVEQRRLATLTQQRRELEQVVAELGSKIEKLPMQEVAEREKARQEKQRQLTEIDQRIGGLQVELGRLARDIQSTQDDLDKAAAKNEKARRLKLRRELAQRASGILEVLLREHEVQAKRAIVKIINDILEQTARRDYTFQFRDGFSMELMFADGRPVPRSSGENQLMSLAFIASLVQFSLSRLKAKEEILIPGTVAPLVLDSPFGQLDVRYRVDTAAFVPKMASQVVLLVSSSQGDPEVLKALAPHVGTEYVLISENKGAQGNRPSDEFVLHGQRIRASIYNCPKTLTRIERVDDANAAV